MNLSPRFLSLFCDSILRLSSPSPQVDLGDMAVVQAKRPGWHKTAGGVLGSISELLSLSLLACCPSGLGIQALYRSLLFVWLFNIQHYPERHGGPERHGRDSRDGWGGYGSDKRISEGRGLPPPPRFVSCTPPCFRGPHTLLAGLMCPTEDPWPLTQCTGLGSGRLRAEQPWIESQVPLPAGPHHSKGWGLGTQC